MRGGRRGGGGRDARRGWLHYAGVKGDRPRSHAHACTGARAHAATHTWLTAGWMRARAISASSFLAAARGSCRNPLSVMTCMEWITTLTRYPQLPRPAKTASNALMRANLRSLRRRSCGPVPCPPANPQRKAKRGDTWHVSAASTGRQQVPTQPLPRRRLTAISITQPLAPPVPSVPEPHDPRPRCPCPRPRLHRPRPRRPPPTAPAPGCPPTAPAPGGPPPHQLLHGRPRVSQRRLHLGPRGAGDGPVHEVQVQIGHLGHTPMGAVELVRGGGIYPYPEGV